MAKYWYIFKSSLRDALFYRSRILSTIVIWLVRTGVLILLYSYAYKYRGGDINGIDFRTAVWSIAVYFTVLAMSLRWVYRDICKDVYEGGIETQINKPYHYLLHRMAGRIGKGIPDFIVSLVAAALILLAFVGVPAGWDISVSWLLKAGSLFIGGLILALWFYSLIGLTAVWLENADAVYFLLDKCTLILGGSYIPVALFPEFVRRIAEGSPFGAVMFVTQIFNPDFGDRWQQLFIVQVTWIAVLVLMTLFVYKLSNKKISINGG